MDPVVEPRGQPDQAAAPGRTVVLLPADPLAGRRLGVHRRGDQGPVPGRPGGAVQGRRRAGQYPFGPAAGELTDLVRPVGPGVVDDVGRAEPVHELMMLRAGRGDDRRTQDAGDLHREMT